MSRVLTINEVCERALRKIGAYSINDAGARAEEIEEARYWLDLIVSHMAGTRRALWLVPTTLEASLTPGDASATFSELFTTDLPVDGIQFPVRATITDSDSDNEIPIEIIRRSQWDEISDKTDTGQPRVLYIDRGITPQVYFWPIPEEDSEYTVRMTVQTFNKDLTTGRPEDEHAIRNTWQLWLITALAAQIGDGPIRHLPENEVTKLERQAHGLLVELDAFDNQEMTHTPRRVSYSDGLM